MGKRLKQNPSGAQQPRPTQPQKASPNGVPQQQHQLLKRCPRGSLGKNPQLQPSPPFPLSMNPQVPKRVSHLMTNQERQVRVIQIAIVSVNQIFPKQTITQLHHQKILLKQMV